MIFGSFVTDPIRAYDLDLLVISEAFSNVYYQNRRDLLPKKYMGKRIDAFCYTPNEFRQLFLTTQPFLKAIKRKYINLIGDLNEYI